MFICWRPMGDGNKIKLIILAKLFGIDDDLFPTLMLLNQIFSLYYY